MHNCAICVHYWFLTLVLMQRSRFACKVRVICVSRAAPHVIQLCSLDFSIFASANRCQPRRRHVRQHTICAVIAQDFKSFSSIKRSNLRQICPTQLHQLGGQSLLWPGLTDTDLESPVFRIARRQCCCAEVLPKAAWPLLPFYCCQLKINYLQD